MLPWTPKRFYELGIRLFHGQDQETRNRCPKRGLRVKFDPRARFTRPTGLVLDCDLYGQTKPGLRFCVGASNVYRCVVSFVLWCAESDYECEGRSRRVFLLETWAQFPDNSHLKNVGQGCWPAEQLCSVWIRTEDTQMTRNRFPSKTLRTGLATSPSWCLVVEMWKCG